MPEISDNMQKYENYREQMGRLKRAMDARFFLEAIFIEYAILEDRLESVLRHSGRWNPKPGEAVSIYKKVKLVEKLAEQKNSPAKRFFGPELLGGILAWKDERNTVIHALLKQDIHSEDLQSIAERGRTLAKELSGKTGAYNRALARLAEREK